MILAKFYNGSTVFLQEFVDDAVSIESDLFTFGTATFTVGINTNIQEKQKVELVEVPTVGSETVVFTGFIYTINPIWRQFSKITVELRSEKAFFDEMVALSNINLSGPITNIQTQLLNPYLAYGLTYSISSDIVENIELLEIPMGDNYSSIIDQICTQFGSYRDIKDGVLYIKKQIGTDRTTGTNYTEAYFNGKFPSENNIKEITGGSVSQRFNLLIAKNQTTTQIFSNYGGVFYGARVKEFRDGSFSAKAQAFLDDGDKEKKNYIFQIEGGSIEAEVGDMIKVIVQNTNQYYDIDAPCMVVKKKVEYNKGKRVSFEFQEFPTQTLTTESFNRRISQQIAYNIVK